MKMIKSYAFSLLSFFFLIQHAYAADSQRQVTFSNGDAVAVWEEPTMSGITLIQAAFYNATTDTWDSVQTISDTNVNSYTPEIGGNDDGDAVVIWTGDNLTDNVQSLYGAMRPLGGSWTTPVKISGIVSTVEEGVFSGYSVQLINNSPNTTSNNAKIGVLWNSTDAVGNLYIRAAVANISANTWGPQVTVGGP